MNTDNNTWDDDFDWNYTRIDNSRPPLRWFANFIGAISSNALLRAVWAQEDGKDKGLKYWLDGKMYKYLFPIYRKWGTFYEMKFDFDED